MAAGRRARGFARDVSRRLQALGSCLDSRLEAMAQVSLQVQPSCKPLRSA